MKPPSLKAAYWTWVMLVAASAGYGLISGTYQSEMSSAIGKAGPLPGGVAPEKLVGIVIALNLAVNAAFIIVAGLLAWKASQARKWAIWALTVLGLWAAFSPVYFTLKWNELFQERNGVVDWLLVAASSLIWLYIIFAAHKLKPAHAGALAIGGAGEDGMGGRLRPALRNLGQGIRGALFARVSHGRIHATWGQLIFLSALALVVQFVIDFIDTGPKGEFVAFGLPGILFGLPLVLLASWAVTARAKRPEQALALAVVLSAIGLVIGAVSPLAHWLLGLVRARGSFPAAGMIAHYFQPAWFALAAGVVAVRLFGATFLQRVSVFLLASVLIGVPLSQIYVNKTLWMQRYDPQALEKEEALRNVLEREDVFYLQPRVLERELAAVKPGPRDRTNLYFVGMAGYSDQDVFMKEVNYVSREFAQRYGTAARSVELINNLGTVGEVPIASVTSLGLSLNRIGEVMNRDRDILFLYLTSHGSRDHQFSLDFGDMQFNALNPFRLRELLDASGIKRRVIVISACYSGGFIDALRDDNTVVITSAAADKTSFGCSNEADFTYFGKAYFQDALPQAASFIDAFNLARPMIARREGDIQEEHSNPQIYVGAAMQDALAAYARQEAATPEAAQSPPPDTALTAGRASSEIAALTQRALMGEADAQFELGARYQVGRGVKRDYAQAVEWLQQSAAQGNTSAMCNLAWAYESGKGVKQDYAKARYLLEKAAARSVPYAQIALGDMYEYGLGVPKDAAKALGYYQKAAERGDTGAQVRVGEAYHRGQGVPQDDARALESYQKAAAQGTAAGYNGLGYFMLERRERMPEAVGYLEKALRMAPDDPSIMDSLGWGYYLTGKTAEGRQLLERANARMKDPVIAAHLGEVLWSSGDKARARDVWRAALKIHPKDPTLTATVKKFTS
jgi:TPR repeat protein